ncbi:MAG: putative glycosyl hydrolase [Verrucomicrobiales bacterium]|nr:putative glycosyl hydrolase [Verrucomicrobiales bacterium]
MMLKFPAALALLPVLIMAAAPSPTSGTEAAAASVSSKNSTTELQSNPFGIASGAEWSGDYPRFEPLLNQAGVGWLRYFREWQGIQPKQGEWNWKWADAFVAAARTNHLQITAPLAYFAPWASSGNDARTFPVKEMQFWKDYVEGVVSRYHQDIQFWEVWNEPQAFQKNGTPQYYAEMVRAAYDAAKKVDPQAKLGLTSANFALAYLNMVLKAGATNHFDYLCVHPYENVEQLKRPGGEVFFLSMVDNVRRLLAAHRQPANIPLWITEIGWQAPIKPDPDKDAQQAQLLVKTYLLSLAQGFEKLFWFEARGPAYGKGTDHGLIRADWTPRPAYDALKTMTVALGPSPRYAGWLDWNGSYGFLFESQQRNVIAAWSPVGQERKLTFAEAVTVTPVTGQERRLGAGQELLLTNLPVFIAHVPDSLVQTAHANRRKPFPWGGDFTKALEVACRWGKTMTSQGLEPTKEVVTKRVGDETFACLNKGSGLNFRVNPGFAPFGTTNLEIRIVARRVVGIQQAGFQLMTESLKTIHGYDRAGWWTIPADEEWHEHTWRLNDANFVGTWGYNLGITEVNGDFLVKEVSVLRNQD